MKRPCHMGQEDLLKTASWDNLTPECSRWLESSQG
jgi:hypothetical protein